MPTFIVTSLLKCREVAAISKNIFDSHKSASDLSTYYILYIYRNFVKRLSYILDKSFVQAFNIYIYISYRDIQDNKLFIATILSIEFYLFKRVENLKTFIEYIT